MGLMSEFMIRHLPIVNNIQLLGLLSEDDILNHDVEEPVGSYDLSIGAHVRVRTKDHLYEVMRILAENELTAVPVIDEEDNYGGLITLEDLLLYFANTTTFREPGSILVLETNRHSYTLAEIARIVESENALILSSFVSSNPDSTRVEVTIKVNVRHLQPILATFQRFNYDIKATFSESDYLDSLKERYDGLMAYLNV